MEGVYHNHDKWQYKTLVLQSIGQLLLVLWSPLITHTDFHHHSTVLIVLCDKIPNLIHHILQYDSELGEQNLGVS